jgi:outer membrane protein assembly factor BamB
MALSVMVKNIRAFYALNTQKREIEKQEKALKAWFLKQAGAAPAATYEDGKIIVSVSTEGRTQVDLKALRVDLGDKIKKYQSTTEIKKVTVRKKEDPECSQE